MARFLVKRGRAHSGFPGGFYTAEYNSKSDAFTRAAREAVERREIMRVYEVPAAGGRPALVRSFNWKHPNPPPSGFIPCKAVKITRNRGKVEVRIRK